MALYKCITKPNLTNQRKPDIFFDGKSNASHPRVAAPTHGPVKGHLRTTGRTASSVLCLVLRTTFLHGDHTNASGRRARASESGKLTSAKNAVSLPV